MADEVTKKTKALSVAERDNLFDDDDDDDLFVDAEDSAPPQPVAPPRNKKAGGAAAGGARKGARPANVAAGVDTVLQSVPQLTARNVSIDSTAIVCENCTTFLTPTALQAMTDRLKPEQRKKKKKKEGRKK